MNLNSFSSFRKKEYQVEEKRSLKTFEKWMNNLKIEVHSFKGLLDTYERAKNDSEEGRTIKNQFAKENSKKEA